MRKTKWLIYTVLIGLIPFFVRALIFLVVRNVDPSYILNEIDMIAFGLVLNVSNITELDGGSNTMSLQWKTINVGISVFMVILFAAFLSMSYIADLPNQPVFEKSSIKYLSLVLSLVSFLFSFSIFRRLT